MERSYSSSSSSQRCSHFWSYFSCSVSLSVSLLERAQSFFFKADEGCLFFENCTKTLNKKILLSLLIELHAARVREIYSTSEPAARKKKQDKI